jgi:hypothetical protein
LLLFTLAFFGETVSHGCVSRQSSPIVFVVKHMSTTETNSTSSADALVTIPFPVRTLNLPPTASQFE